MAEKDTATRRDFLKLTGTATPAVALVVAAGASGTAEAAEPDLTVEKMQDTAHVRTYYDTARF